MPPALRSITLRSQTKASSNSAEPQASNDLSVNQGKNPSLKEKLDAATRQIKTSSKKKSCKRIKYQKASFDLRARLVQMVDIEGYSIRQAAKKLALKYSTAKCIYKLFVDESRLGTTHVSKEELLKNDDEKDSTDTEDQNKDVSQQKIHPTLTKKVKKEGHASLAENEIKQEDLQDVKKEFDDWSEAQTKAKASCQEADKFKENTIIQADSSQPDSSEVPTPLLQMRNIGSTSSRLPPSDPRVMSYLPQAQPNFVFLLPVQIPGNLLGKFPAGDCKTAVFGASQQTQAFNFLNCQMPPNYFLNNAAVSGLMARANLSSQLRFGGANNS